MSLYIGNISSRINRDELQRVFQKFGRCNVRVKDGYGFVVYDFPPDAEKALRALQKKYICGQPLTLTWSNKQPRPSKRLTRATGSFDPQHDRRLEKGQDYVKRKPGSKNQDSVINMRDKEVEFHQDDAKDNLCEENNGCREEFEDEVGRSEPDPLENDRWGEKFHEKPIEIGLGNEVEFERYEPYRGYNTKYDDDINQLAHHGGSPSRKSPPKDHVNGNLEVPSNVKFDLSCYRCGGLGHKRRNCPQKGSSFRNSTGFDRRHNGDIHRRGRRDTEVGKLESWSRKRLESSRDTVVNRRVGNSPVRKGTDNSWKKNYGGNNKRSRNEISSSSRRGTKKTRMSSLTSGHSISQSTEHVIRSSSKNRSNSVSSRAHSPPSKSKSSSPPLVFRSRSSSSHTSLSVSVGRPLPSSLNKCQLNLKGSSENATTPESKALSIDLDQPLEGHSGLEDKTHENTKVVENNEKVVLHSKEEINLKKDQPLEKDNEVHSNSDNLMTEEKVIFPMKNLDSESLLGSNSGNPTSISSEELSIVLKHYCGVHLQNESDLSADEYFGSARMWPWEVIYYRRLKKGLISLENYARRVDQNRDFGILDKYVRSSSGWGELYPENPRKF